MDLIDRLRELASRIPRQLEHIQTEEATKNALVMPFISALGYNVFDPTEVTPELNADIGVKKGEKVDYAILKEGKPIILFECKHHSTDLAHAHASQLYRYFSVTEARFGVLTNGLVYWFYTDLDAPNKMDSKPFFEFNVLDIRDDTVDELKKFSKSAFDLNNIITTASELKYTREITRLLVDQLQEPSDDFVKYIVSHVYTGRITQPVREQFAQLTKQAFNNLVNNSINERLKSALENSSRSEGPVSPLPQGRTEQAEEQADESVVRQDKQRGIVTTEEEIEALFAVKSILRGVVDVKRVHMRDAKNYCNVLLDYTNRKPICRLHFNREQKYLGVFDDDKQEQRLPIEDVEDIYTYAPDVVATVQRYELQVGASARGISTKPASPPKLTAPTTQAEKRTSYTGSKPRAYVFQGVRQEVGSWKDAMLAILELARRRDPKRFEQVALTLVGRKRPYITVDKSQLRSAEAIANTRLFVETNLDTDSIVKLCYDLIEKMGCPRDDLTFETE